MLCHNSGYLENSLRVIFACRSVPGECFLGTAAGAGGRIGQREKLSCRVSSSLQGSLLAGVATQSHP